MKLLKAKKHPLFNCGNINCPLCNKAYSMLRIKKRIEKENFQSDGVSPFIGRYGYPNINVGILAPPEETNEAWMYDAPRYWSSHNYQIPRLIELRSSLINSRFNINIKKTNRFLNINQEIAMASKPADIEINLKEKPKFRINVDNYAAPHGPNAILKKVQLTENPKISYKVEKVVSDIDLKANDALIYLYNSNFDENFLSKILSVGILGLKKNRKLVPTRWSLTSVDSKIGNYLVSKVKNYNQCNYLAFFGGYLGNFYLIMFFPEVWNYELFETHISNVNRFMTDYELYEGRKYYVEETAGGFYACRIVILEKLEEMKRQASVLALRFITGDYTLPLGVFVCRESSRKALKNKPIEFGSRELMLKYAQILVKRKFKVDIDLILKKSILLKNMRQQSKLVKFT